MIVPLIQKKLPEIHPKCLGSNMNRWIHIPARTSPPKSMRRLQNPKSSLFRKNTGGTGGYPQKLQELRNFWRL